MSIPRKSVLRCSRGALLHTRLSYQSPEYNSDTNITINNFANNNPVPLSYPTVDMNNGNNASAGNGNGNADNSNEIMNRDIKINEIEDNDNKNSSNQTNTFSNITSLNNVKIDDDKDLLIRALCKTIDIIEDNPLLINKFIIAKEEDLRALIRLLTKADCVDIQIIEQDVSCIKSNKYRIVNKILLQCGNEIVNLKHAFADVVNYFDTYKISLKFVV